MTQKDHQLMLRGCSPFRKDVFLGRTGGSDDDCCGNGSTFAYNWTTISPSVPIDGKRRF